MFKANLEISVSREKTCYTSDSRSSLSDSDYESRDKLKTARRRRRKKKSAKKVRERIVQTLEYSDSEVQLKKSSERCISVLELLPETKARSQSWHRRTPQMKYVFGERIFVGYKFDFLCYRSLYENRRSTMQQLAEVQAKLISLRNKLWFGIGDSEGGAPLSWGDNSFCVYNSTPQLPMK